MRYRDFIAAKAQRNTGHGFDPASLPEHLFDFQRELVTWATRQGRAHFPGQIWHYTYTTTQRGSRERGRPVHTYCHFWPGNPGGLPGPLPWPDLALHVHNDTERLRSSRTAAWARRQWSWHGPSRCIARRESPCYCSPPWPSASKSSPRPPSSATTPHSAALQLDVIERFIDLRTAPGERVLTPFMGVGSEVYAAVRMGRYGIGAELKPSYYQQAVRNLAAVDDDQYEEPMLFLDDGLMV